MRIKLLLTSLLCLCFAPAIFAQGNCQANFTFNAGNCPLVSFADASTATGDTVKSWSWDFGDGNFGSGQIVNHSYTVNGNYLVCLQIGTNQGCTNTFCDTVTISCIGASTCQAGFQSVTSNCPTISFFDGSTAQGTILTWSWDFGDGNTSTIQNPTHTYTQNGSYNVCLTITTNDTCSNIACNNVNITCITGGGTCQAGFQALTNNCPTFSFFDGSSASPGIVNGWAWDFGDGNTSAAQNPTHTYTANGNYIVCLDILTSDQCSSQFCDTLVVNCITGPTCTADFNINTGFCPSFGFNDASTSGSSTVTGWAWDFGDGNTSAQQSPMHTYVANGTYIVCLTITTADQCTDTKCDSVVVNCISGPVCQANYSVDLSACPTADFTDLSVSNPGTISSWSWDFGDGNTSTVQNPSHTYTANGGYQVSLNIVTTDQCSSLWVDSLYITCITSGQCQAIWQANTSQEPAVQFFDGSTASPGTIISWAWDFGDGATSTLQNPNHTYTANGDFNVCLTIMTDDQCTATSCDTVTITGVGISELNAEAKVEIFPNPARDQLWVAWEMPEGQTAGLELIAVTGKVLLRKSFAANGERVKVETGHLPAGVYFVRLQTGKTLVLRKLLLVD